MLGILAFGAYVPRLRLQRQAVAAAHAWFNPALKTYARGERAMANWDEDCITMAVEAGRDCLAHLERSRVSRVMLASTSHPFADRQNAGVVKEALNLSDSVASLDVSGSQRAATSALLDALYASKGGAGEVLCIGSEKRRTKPASELELIAGDAAAALLVGEGEVLAEFLGGHSITIDFVDHVRADGQDHDYGWESRWVRDEGYAKIAPRAVKAALAKVSLEASAVDHFIIAAPIAGVNESVARASGIPPRAVCDSLAQVLGEAGTAQPLILLAHVLEHASAGDIVVVAGFGQGCDVLIFRVTHNSPAAVPLGVSGWLRRRKPESNYLKFLAFTHALELDAGMRAEFEPKTALTALYRDRKTVLAMVGGRCSKTGVVQFPRSEVSVAQNDRAVGSQEDYPFADRVGRILTHTADRLTFTPDPPAYYGAVAFDAGGRATLEFTDVESEDVAVGAAVRMMFRIKATDPARSFIKYFWKAVPDYRALALPAPAAREGNA